MSNEEKELLLKDLCSRLPYEIICYDPRYGDSKITEIDIRSLTAFCEDFDDYVVIGFIKPYLRSMSSMTKDEREDYFLLSHRDTDREDNVILIEEASELLDWLNSHHFDYRDLIEKGLALEAPEEMYK